MLPMQCRHLGVAGGHKSRIAAGLSRTSLLFAAMVDLDDASLLCLFSGLPGETIAACAQVLPVVL